MKKVISIILSLVMLISVGVLAMPVFAEEDTGGLIVGSQETVTTPDHNKIIPQVNGKDDNDVTWEWISDNPKQIKFTYNGDGTLKGWEFGDLVEGKDYKVVSKDGNSITIELLTDYDGDIIANAIVEEEEEPTESTTSQVSTTTVSPTSNNSSTSPKTGAAAAAGIAVMGAGVAILTALKKKED